MLKSRNSVILKKEKEHPLFSSITDKGLQTQLIIKYWNLVEGRFLVAPEAFWELVGPHLVAGFTPKEIKENDEKDTSVAQFITQYHKGAKDDILKVRASLHRKIVAWNTQASVPGHKFSPEDLKEIHSYVAALYIGAHCSNYINIDFLRYPSPEKTNLSLPSSTTTTTTPIIKAPTSSSSSSFASFTSQDSTSTVRLEPITVTRTLPLSPLPSSPPPPPPPPPAPPATEHEVPADFFDEDNEMPPPPPPPPSSY
jgi:hypothetical protein